MTEGTSGAAAALAFELTCIVGEERQEFRS
jgi:hypothetical protein